MRAEYEPEACLRAGARAFFEFVEDAGPSWDRLVASNSPHKPLPVDEIRKRVRIIDALDGVTPENTNGYFMLEDDDHKALVTAVNDFPWATASHTLLTIIDDVIGAETMPKSSMKLVEQ